MKPIRLSGHARENLLYRGTSEEEVIATIRNSSWFPAKEGRWEASKEYAFGKEWNGKIYKWKRVRPIFVEEIEGIVVVTVYVYFYSEREDL